MKKFLIYLSCVAFGVMIIDLTARLGYGYMFAHVPENAELRQRFKYEFVPSKTDILIVGASRAMFCYDPKIISDSTGMTAYDAGLDGVGVIGQYITIRNFFERGNAKVVVYDLGSLQLSKEWNQDKISSYFPYYWTDNTVREVVDDCLPEARYLLLSALYQYNSCLHDVFRAYIQKKVVTDGFEELPYTGTTWKPLYYKEKAESYKADPRARSYLDKIVALCKQHGVKLILTMAPGLGSGFKSTQLFLKEYSEANKVLFWDFTDLEALHHDSRYFKDYNHINSEGVKIFTPVIAGKLKSNMGHIIDQYGPYY